MPDDAELHDGLVEFSRRIVAHDMLSSLRMYREKAASYNAFELPGADALSVATSTEGERQLMGELIRQAMVEATFGSCAMQQAARAWLSEAPSFSARECFEALGVDYDVALPKLQAKWAALDTSRATRNALRKDRERRHTRTLKPKREDGR